MLRIAQRQSLRLTTVTSRYAIRAPSFNRVVTVLALASARPAPRPLHTSSSTKLATPLDIQFNMPQASSYPTAPVPPPSFPSEASAVTKLVDDAIQRTREVYDKVAALSEEQCTFETVARPIAFRMAKEAAEAEPSLFMQYVSTEAAVRDASVEADKKMQDFSLSAITRVDVYKALRAAEAHTKKNNVSLNPEEQRLLDRMILDRTRSGLGLPDDKREELLANQKKIMGLEVDFQKNCNEEKGFLLFTAGELDGVPDIDGYAQQDGKYKVTHKTPDITPVFKYAHNPETRKKAVLSFEGKTVQNAPLLAEIVKLRREAARILGYDNHADFRLEVKMAKDSKTVLDFLSDLQGKLKSMGEAERKKLLDLKKSEHEKRGLPEDNLFRVWDYRYYDRLWTERELSLDENKISEYFVVSDLVPRILGLYHQLLGVDFHPVPRTKEAGGITWHDEAEMYAVRSAPVDGGESEHLGYMLLDLFPRENKYGHAAVWGLIPGYTNEEGKRSYPTVCMVANLSKPSANKPALMKHNDVVTYFHEMGHALHGLCSKTQFSKFHGTAVARDFVEAPSQMLENWMWTPGVIKTLSSHYKDQSKLDDKLITSLIKSKNVNQGLFNLRQIFFATYDMKVHTTDVDSDLTQLWCGLREEISLVSSGGENVGGQSGFAHIAGGYDAGYYGYLWSQAFSADMFKTVFKADPMSSKSGLKYREEILKPGGSRDEAESLKAFLGRPPNNEAFLESLFEGQEKQTASL